MVRIKTIWIDICHTPQAVFYIPIIRELRSRGYSVLITVQESAESCQLLEKAGLTFTQVGKKFGRRKLSKFMGLITRTLLLWRTVHKMHIQFAVSQGSPYQILVCKIQRIPSVVIGDNEHGEWMFIKFANKCLYAHAMPDHAIKVPLKKVVKFPGLKEEVYLSDFRPNPYFLSELNLDSKRCIVTLRSPATFAYYHNTQSELLLYKLVSHLLASPTVQIVFLPRNKKEERQIEERFSGDVGDRIYIPHKVLDGLNLIWHSDAVFSGGGTMIREAALMNVPAYSYFQGETLAVDRFLFHQKKLKFIRSENDIQKIHIQKRDKKSYTVRNNGLRKWIVNEILLGVYF